MNLLCKFYKIHRSSYYKWLKTKDNVNFKNYDLKQKILNFHDLYKNILGYRRMTLWINKSYNTNYNIKRIRRLMKELGISSAIRRKKKNYISYIPE
ncbi:MAG: IS3 family transposase [Anaeroplasmataceae bacterium]